MKTREKATVQDLEVLCMRREGLYKVKWVCRYRYRNDVDSSRNR